MDDIEIEHEEAFRRLIEQYNSGSLSFEGLQRSVLGMSQSASASEKALKGLGTASLGVTKTMGNFTRTVASSQGSFSGIASAVEGVSDALGSAIPIIGGFVSGMGKAVAFGIERLEKSFDSFQSLSEAGLISAKGLTGLRENFDKAGIPLEKYSAMLKKNSEDLAYTFGSAMKGGDKFADAMETMMNGSNDQLRNMGFSVAEMGQTVVDYQKMQKRMGMEQVMTQQQLATAATEYDAELDLLAKITGETRQGAQQERDNMMRDSRFRAKIETMRANGEGEAATELMNYVAMIKSTSPELAKAAMDLSTGFVITEEAIKATVSGFGSTINKSVKLIVTGAGSATEGFQAVTDTAKEAEKQQRSHSLAVGDSANVFINYAQVADLARRAGISPDDAKKLLEAQLNQKNATDSNTEAMVDAETNMMRAAVNLDMLSTSGDFAAKAVEFFADGMVKVTNMLRKMVGKITGEEVEVSAKDQLLTEKVSAQDEVAKAKADLDKANRSGASEADLQDLRDILGKKETALSKSKDRISKLSDYNNSPIGKQRTNQKDLSAALTKQAEIKLEARENAQQWNTNKSRFVDGKSNKELTDEDKAELKIRDAKKKKDQDNYTKKLKVQEEIIEKLKLEKQTIGDDVKKTRMSGTNLEKQQKIDDEKIKKI